MPLNDETRLKVLGELARVIAARRDAAADESYTASLLARGVAKCAQKTGEEAVELVIAAVTGNPEEICQESADLLYHLLVTLEATGVTLDDVLEELARRQGIGGFEEKASRSAE